MNSILIKVPVIVASTSLVAAIIHFVYFCLIIVESLFFCWEKDISFKWELP